MTKKEILEEIKNSVSHIESVQKMAIEPYEEKVTLLLMELFPKIPKPQAQDWMLDVVYNDPENTLKRMEEIFN
jgi:hypothetical protein